MKQLFGPSFWMFLLKAVLTVPVFYIVGFFVGLVESNMMDYHYQGFPFKYSEGGGMCPWGSCGSTHNYWNLTWDILIWFIVTCAIVTFISLLFKNKKGSQKQENL